MGRKKLEINKISGNRLRELLKENSLTQQGFSEQFGYTEQHVSLLVTGKRRLTPEAARKLADMFPPVRFEWLMGFDDYKTPMSKRNADSSKLLNEGRLLVDSVAVLSYLAGYEFVLFEDADESGNHDIVKALADINEGYKIFYGGNKIASCSIERFNQIASEVLHFAGYLIQNLIKKEDVSDAK